MKSFVVILLLLAAADLWAFRGVVETIGGEKFQGEIRLEKDSCSLTQTNGALQKIALAQIALLRAEPWRKPSPRDPESDPHAQPTEEHETAKAVPGVQLIGGSFIARRVHLADDTWIKFSDSPKESSLSTLSVARIFFQPPTPEMEAKLHAGCAGLLLKRNDFIESEFKGIAHGKIKVSSVLFGMKSYDPAQVQVLALRDPQPASAKYELRTKSDSHLHVNSFSVDRDRLIIQDPAMAGFQIAVSDLAEIRRCPTASRLAEPR